MSLQHSNIAQVLDLGVAGGRYFLALELVDGWDLEKHPAARLRGGHRLAGRAQPLRRGVRLPRAGLRARQGARRQAAGHRPPRHQPEQRADQRSGRDEADRLRHREGAAQARADRGRRHQGQGRVHVARAGAGARPSIERSDIFSVGSMLYRMVTEKLPFEAGDDMESLLRVQKAEFTPPEQVEADGRARGVAGIIMRAMRLSPKRALPDRGRDAGRRRARAAHRVPLGGADGAEAVAGAARPPRRRADDREAARSTRAASSRTRSRPTCRRGRRSSSTTSTRERERRRPSSRRRGTRREAAAQPEGGWIDGAGGDRAAARGAAPGFWLGVIFALAAVVGIRYAKNWAEQKGVVGVLGLGGDAEREPGRAGRRRRPAPTTRAARAGADGDRAPAPTVAAPRRRPRRRRRARYGCRGTPRPRPRRRRPLRRLRPTPTRRRSPTNVRPMTRPPARAGRGRQEGPTTTTTRRGGAAARRRPQRRGAR